MVSSKNFTRRSRKPASGQSLLELAAGLMVAIPILLVLLDCIFLGIGVSAHDMACRDAARAAASGPPAMMASGTRSVSAAQDPRKRAAGIIDRIYHLSIPIKVHSESLEVTENLQSPIPSAPAGGAVNGTVSVRSTVDIYPPFLTNFVNSKVTLQSYHSYPYTYTLPGSGV